MLLARRKITPASMLKQAGFTLIEAMITVAVLGLLAAIAWPLYNNQLLENRRRDALNGLLPALQEMQQCKTDRGSYTGCAPSTLTSPNGLYAITFAVTGGGSGFTLTATKSLADDPECASFTIDNLGRKSYTGTAPSINRCWVN